MGHNASRQIARPETRLNEKVGCGHEARTAKQSAVIDRGGLRMRKSCVACLSSPHRYQEHEK